MALIIFVNHNNTDSNQTLTPRSRPRSTARPSSSIAADQAPHVVTLTAAREPPRGVRAHGARHDAASSTRGVVDGPLQRARCTRHGGGGGRPAFSCVATADDVNYDFVGVVDVAARQLTYCRRDEPPVPSTGHPGQPRCTA